MARRIKRAEIERACAILRKIMPTEEEGDFLVDLAQRVKEGTVLVTREHKAVKPK